MTLETAGVFFVLSCTFFYTSIRMISALKQNFNEFYTEYRKLLWTATLLLAVPLCLRAISQLIKGNTDFKLLPLWEAMYNMVYFICSTYLPILFQITTLIFGFVRHK